MNVMAWSEEKCTIYLDMPENQEFGVSEMPIFGRVVIYTNDDLEVWLQFRSEWYKSPMHRMPLTWHLA